MTRWLLGALGMAMPLMASDNAMTTASHAYTLYVEGETATDIKVGQRSFNEALALYGVLGDRVTSGKIQYNIGNCYYQLGDMPRAILHYRRASEALPRDERVQNNLHQALNRSGVVEPPSSGILQKIFFLHVYSSVQERWAAFSGLVMLALMFASISVWWPKKRFRRLTIVVFVLAAVPLASIAVTTYFTSLAAVVVEASPLYRDAGFQYAAVGDTPAFAGSSVKVLASAENGQWLKVTTSDGTMGYLPSNALRLVAR